jgi:DNA-binding ferritin-like protein
MKRRLVEAVSHQDYKQSRYAAQELMQSQMAVYDGKDYQYADLAVWLGFMRALMMIHHSHHWQAMGTSYYGDHELLKKIYEATQDEVDSLGEKIIALDSPALTNYFLQVDHMRAFMEALSDKQKQPLVVSFLSELAFIHVGEGVSKRLQEAGLLTTGLENLMGGILDRHETHVYLLKQRLAQIKV